ncbi:MAG TPA: hypothetical protein VF275_02230 [Gammaproteobacteria bacterium]
MNKTYLSKRGVATVALLLSFYVGAGDEIKGSKLETDNYIVYVQSNCVEGVVSCSDMTYVGISKRTGNKIVLKGSTMHSTDVHGAPGQFQGYEFKNGNITYLVYASGRLEVIRNRSEILVSEDGKWIW